MGIAPLGGLIRRVKRIAEEHERVRRGIEAALRRDLGRDAAAHRLTRGDEWARGADHRVLPDLGEMRFEHRRSVRRAPARVHVREVERGYARASLLEGADDAPHPGMRLPGAGA